MSTKVPLLPPRAEWLEQGTRFPPPLGGNLPPSFRQPVGPIGDQRSKPSCLAHTVVEGQQALFPIAGFEASPVALWTLARFVQGRLGDGLAGTRFEYIARALQVFGLPKKAREDEDSQPFAWDEHAPTEEQLACSQRVELEHFSIDPQDSFAPTRLMCALVDGWAVVVAFGVRPGFDSVRADELLDPYVGSESSGHAMRLTEYRWERDGLVWGVQNHYGPDWCDGGRGRFRDLTLAWGFDCFRLRVTS